MNTALRVTPSQGSLVSRVHAIEWRGADIVPKRLRPLSQHG
jgi:hypothetical protein